MSTETMTTDDLTTTVAVHDEDGKPAVITIRVVEDGDAYLVEVIEDNDQVDFEEVETIDEAGRAVAEFAVQIKAEDRKRERDRIRDARKYAAECLHGTAAELPGGVDRDAIKLLSLLVAAGRGSAALVALGRVALANAK